MILENNIESDMVLVKNQKYNYKFKQGFNRVWNFMKDVTKTYEAVKDMRTQAIFTKGNSSYEKGAEFTFDFKNFFPLFFRVHEVIELPEYRKLHYKIDCRNTHKQFEYIYHFYNVSNEKCTLLVWDWIYEGEGALLSLKELEEIDKNRKEMMRKFENYLENNILDLSQHESIIVNFPIDRVWKIISNWSIFHKLVPVISDEIEFIGNPQVIGSIISLNWNKNPQKIASCKLKIKEAISYPQEKDYILKLICIQSSSNVPKHELVIKLASIEEKETFVEFMNYFLEPVNEKMIKKFSKYKIRLLKHFKYSLGKFKI